MEKVKIDIISGFLGAGKTTFIKKLIKDLYQGEKVVILENEFGKINIDEETLERERIAVKPIQAGCICCSSSMSLSKGIIEIMKEFQPERIIVEPTGIAKLSEVKKILQYEELECICELDHIVTIVDAKNYYKRAMISLEFFEDQIRTSRVIFLSKTNELDETARNQVIAAIKKVNPGSSIIHAPWDSISKEELEALLYPKEEENRVKKSISMRINYRNDFESYEFVSELPFNMEEVKLLTEKLEKGGYGEIHRVKGFCKDQNQGFYSIDYVPGETVMKLIDMEHAKSSQTRLCLIGRDLDREKLAELF